MLRIEMNTGTLHLAKGQLLRLADADGHTVCSADGAIWVTEDGSREDVVLQAGSCHRLSAGALVQALSPATLSLA